MSWIRRPVTLEQRQGNVDALERLLANTERLSAVTQLLASRADNRDWWARVTEAARTITGADGALLNFVCDDARLVTRAGSAQAIPERVPNAETYCQNIVSLAKPLVIEDSVTDPLVSDLAAAKVVRAYLGVPLVVEGHVVGAFCALSDTPRQWSAAELDAMQRLVALIHPDSTTEG